MNDTNASSPIIVVTGANGLVGAQVCRALTDRGARVRAVVRRPGTAPDGAGVEEHVGDFHDADLAASVVRGADGVITTVHPLGSDRETQVQVAVKGTPVIARAARDAGVARLVHISTAAVYDRSPTTGDVDEDADLVADNGGAYAVTKRDTDAALARIEEITRILLRPPAILGSGPTSVWNRIRPAAIRDDPDERRANPEQTFAWVHVDDLARLAAMVATGGIPSADDPDEGPVPDRVTVVNVAAPRATVRDYHGTVTEALGVEPVWTDDAAWTGALLAGRAHGWGWTPQIDLSTALRQLREEVAQGV